MEKSNPSLYLPGPAPTSCRAYESDRIPQIVVIVPGGDSQVSRIKQIGFSPGAKASQSLLRKQESR
jgi:hypothetical protein